MNEDSGDGNGAFRAGLARSAEGSVEHMTHPTEELVRRVYEEFAAGDMDGLRSDFDPEIVWHNPGRGAVAGDYRGIDDVLAFFGKVGEISAGTFTAELRDVLANDAHAVALHVGRAQSGERTLDEINVLVIHTRQGRVSEVWEHHHDLYAVDEFWG